jgi:hypothetical protein
MRVLGIINSTINDINMFFRKEQISKVNQKFQNSKAAWIKKVKVRLGQIALYN